MKGIHKKLMFGVLILSFINPYFYGTRVLLLLIPLIVINIKKIINYIDINIFLLFIFSIAFYFINFNNSVKPDLTFSAIIVESLLFPSLYLSCKYLFSNLKADVKIKYLLLLSISLAIVPIYSILEQISLYGFDTGSRSMYIIWDRSTLKSATVLGGSLVLLTTFYASILYNKKNLFYTILMVIFALINTLCYLRLGSRTMIICSLIPLIITLFFQKKKESLRSLFIGILSINILFFLVSRFVNIDFTLFYQDRMDSNSAGSIESAGGRSSKWDDALDLMVTHPFGWDLKEIGYVHNFWLDIYRTSGVIPFILISIITIIFFKNFFKYIKVRHQKNNFLFFMVFNFYTVIILLFTVEPIMDGFKLLFCFFILLNSLIISEIKNEKSTIL